MARFGLTEQLTKVVKVMKECACGYLGERVRERTASAKALRQKCTQEVLGTARRQEWLECRKQKEVL